jgi:hypothetical protein
MRRLLAWWRARKARCFCHSVQVDQWGHVYKSTRTVMGLPCRKHGRRPGDPQPAESRITNGEAL